MGSHNDILQKTQLERLLTRWRQLTEAETRAIAANDWTGVANLETLKANLQPAISAASGGQPGECPVELRPILEELIRLEQANQERVTRRLTAAREERRDLDRTTHNLRRIQKSYGSAAYGTALPPLTA